MRLLFAIALLFAFVTNGAVAQFRAEANSGVVITASEGSLVSGDFTGHWTTGKVCVRKLLTGLPANDTGLPGPPCSSDFKLFREAGLMRFPETGPPSGFRAGRKLQANGPGSPLRPPIS